jgi:hypothetical protein
LVLGLALIQLSRTTAFGHALGSTIIAVGIAPASVGGPGNPGFSYEKEPSDV